MEMPAFTSSRMQFIPSCPGHISVETIGPPGLFHLRSRGEWSGKKSSTPFQIFLFFLRPPKIFIFFSLSHTCIFFFVTNYIFLFFHGPPCIFIFSFLAGHLRISNGIALGIALGILASPNHYIADILKSNFNGKRCNIS